MLTCPRNDKTNSDVIHYSHALSEMSDEEIADEVERKRDELTKPAEHHVPTVFHFGYQQSINMAPRKATVRDPNIVIFRLIVAEFAHGFQRPRLVLHISSTIRLTTDTALCTPGGETGSPQENQGTAGAWNQDESCRCQAR